MSTSPGTGDDRILLRTYAAKGDPAAFAELVRRYADMVYATARRVTGNPTTAEDVSQDCFLRLAQSAAAVRGSLAAWLHRTSLNRSLEMLRSERARRGREAAAAQTASPASDDAAELVAKVDEALAALPADLRVVVTEHFLLGRQQGEIAESLGLSQPTVSRRIEKGLTQLRQWLAKNGVAAAAVMPAFFLEAAQVTAPATLRSALTKIGLSGVGGPAPATAVGALKPAAAVTATLLLCTGLIAGAWRMLQPPRVSQVTLGPAATARPANPPAGGPRAVGSTVTTRQREIELAAVIPRLPARDMDASIAFYQRMGFRLRTAGVEKLVRRDDIAIELIAAATDTPTITIRVEVSNVAGFQRELRERNIDLQPDSNPTRFAVVDPTGNRLIFEEEP